MISMSDCESVIDVKLSDEVEKNNTLTKQQKDFCLYFTRNRNATWAYMKAYRCLRSSARANGARMIANDSIQAELRRLRDIKNAILGTICGEDIVELHMRIAFSDITDFVDFFDREVHIKDGCTVDGSLISEVSSGKDGVKIKMVDKQQSLRFLENYFELNKMNGHRKEYENAKLDIERQRLGLELLKVPDDNATEGEDLTETDAAIYN